MFLIFLGCIVDVNVICIAVDKGHAMAKLTKDFLKRLIVEELSKLHEGEEEDAVAELMKSSKDLMTSMEKFQTFLEKSPVAKNAVDPHFTNLMGKLKEFFNDPKKFVTVAPAQSKPVTKKVSLKPTNKVF
jgi:hypothetical protein